MVTRRVSDLRFQLEEVLARVDMSSITHRVSWSQTTSFVQAPKL